MEGSKFDVRKLMRENFSSAGEMSVNSFTVYILLHTEEQNFLVSESQDIDRVEFYNKVEDEVVFKDPNGQLIVLKESDYKTKWVNVSVQTIAGTTLNAAYEELVYFIQNQLPPHLKGKVKF